jgi:hypothetical protein
LHLDRLKGYLHETRISCRAPSHDIARHLWKKSYHCSSMSRDAARQNFHCSSCMYVNTTEFRTLTQSYYVLNLQSQRHRCGGLERFSKYE